VPVSRARAPRSRNESSVSRRSWRRLGCRRRRCRRTCRPRKRPICSARSPSASSDSRFLWRTGTAGAELARAALAQAGLLLAAQPRPRGAARAELLPLHLADPPLPRPRLPPCAALGGWRRRAGAAGRRARRAGRVELGMRARGDDGRARCRRRGGLLRSRAPTVRARLGAAVRGRSRRADLGRGLCRFRAGRLRGRRRGEPSAVRRDRDGERSRDGERRGLRRPVAGTRAAARRRRARLVGDQRGGDDPARRAYGA